MTPDLQKKLVRAASYIFTVIVFGAFFAKNWWLLTIALFVVIVLRLLALLISDKSKRLIQKLIERLPILASFFILVIFTGVVCLVLAIGLKEGLKFSKKYSPGSGPIEAHGTSDSVTATVQHPPQPPPEVAKPVPEPVPKPVDKPSLTKPKAKVSKETTKNNATGNITNAPGGIVNNGGTITNPTVINNPPTNPLDPYDGKPDLKVAEDAIGMGDRFLNSVKSCNEGWSQALQQDIDTKSPTHPMSKFYISRAKGDIQKYSKDLRDLQASLIYRLGPAERDADADETLDRLLEKRNSGDLLWYLDFNCFQFQKMGEYFNRLGNKLKIRASHP